MLELVTSIGKLVLGFLGMMGPLVLLMAFLRSRELREAKLRTRVLQELNLPGLRGLFSIKIKSQLIGEDTVTVDLWNCSRKQLWDLIERLSDRLPGRVRVEVNGVSSRRFNSELSLTFRNGPDLAHCRG